MAMYALWDMRSGNLMGDYDSEALALETLAAAIGVHGEGYAETVALVRVGPQGTPLQIAAGAELAERAMASQRVIA